MDFLITFINLSGCLHHVSSPCREEAESACCSEDSSSYYHENYVQNGLEIISHSEQRTLLCLTTSDKEGIPNITFDDKSQRRLDNCANEKFILLQRLLV